MTEEETLPEWQDGQELQGYLRFCGEQLTWSDGTTVYLFGGYDDGKMRGRLAIPNTVFTVAEKPASFARVAALRTIYQQLIAQMTRVGKALDREMANYEKELADANPGQ